MKHTAWKNLLDFVKDVLEEFALPSSISNQKTL